MVAPFLGQPKTPPSPLSTVPFRRDPGFIDRGTVLDQMQEKCSRPASIIALVGLSSVEKSQLFIQYCYRVRDQSPPETWVFWIHTSNTACFKQSYREIADRAKIRNRKSPKINIFEPFYDWLQDEEKRKQIIVFDNLNDGSFLHEAPHTGQDQLESQISRKPLMEYLPPTPHSFYYHDNEGPRHAGKNTEDQNIINVEPRDDSQALKLLRTKLGPVVDSGDIRELVIELELIPLAIV
ncbi:kinesin light chain [Blastomyces gilchristii SLH14081]|uniref:Kinesin light chain n=1 Tax=Blastomyces gilchristii (strain SLH14081) TaxID=559298 RepID=A0A179UH57_BLAGS|nr:kinesin light chain [Blastomyces gilchristii SLH14081]OAT06341.1 kinesin light chain [Blastomyces gilchristii SLH14081]